MYGCSPTYLFIFIFMPIALPTVATCIVTTRSPSAAPPTTSTSEHFTLHTAQQESTRRENCSNSSPWSTRVPSWLDTPSLPTDTDDTKELLTLFQKKV